MSIPLIVLIALFVLSGACIYFTAVLLYDSWRETRGYTKIAAILGKEIEEEIK